MAWNEPGDDDKKKDPWGNNGNQNGNQGPPDLDEALEKLNESFAGLFGGKGKKTSSGTSGSNGSGGSNSVFAAVAAIALIAILGFNSVYTVNEQERGIILRFGRIGRGRLLGGAKRAAIAR